MDGKDKALKEEVRPRNVTPLRSEAEIIQLIIFSLGDEEFGADIAQVREIIRRSTITPIPDSPDFIKGITNVRGEIAVAIDLKSRFSLPSNKTAQERHIVMAEQDKNLFGLMVDEVTEVLRIPRTEIKMTPNLVTQIDRVYISGVITIENRLIMMLDLTKVLSEEELKKLSEIGVRHRQTIERPGDSAEKAEVEVTRAEAIPLKTEMANPTKQAKRKKQGGLNA